jgi:hypothetical protein
MATRYQIRLKNLAGAQVGLITDWRTLIYTKRVNNVDDYTLVIDGELALVDDFVLDGQIEILRRDIASSPPIPSTVDFEGFHRTTVRETNVDGLSTFTSRGAGYDDLLRRRAILYLATTAQAEKSGIGETVMKEYVDENAGSGATAPPRLFAGVNTGFTIQADGAAGTAWEGERSFRPLLAVLREIAEATDVDFKVNGTGPATFQFTAQARPLGIDRSQTGIDPATGLNAAGNAPLVFALGFGNMGQPVYSLQRSAEVNAVIVLGQGNATNRVVEERTSEAVSASTWNRLESVQNANQEALIAGLDVFGDAILAKLQAKEDFNFEVIQTDATKYGRDYFLGDLVTARYKDIERTKQIISVTVSVVTGNETITVELGDIT